jgi:hypothetical protein
MPRRGRFGIDGKVAEEEKRNGKEGEGVLS